MKAKASATELIREALKRGAVTFREIQLVTGLNLGALKQGLVRLREAGEIVVEGEIHHKRYRIADRAERAKRCALAEVWRGVSEAA